jgi:alkanesulfonate monooxygenase SsuD/methylene tetrahydromethanopterin reductase-like flavin-dependent oxidoreductase (luciferase family)
MPKPLQPGGIPIWISGTVNKRVARRLSNFGTRWIPWGPAISNFEESVPAMKKAIADVGGDPTDLAVQGAAALKRGADGGIDVGASLAPVAKQVAAGATDIRFSGSLSKDVNQAQQQLSQLVAAFRSATR